MGCDIHIYVERRDPDSGAWVAIDGPNLMYPVYEQWIKEGRAEKIPSYARERSYGGWLYEGRSYTLFAILADVRNYDNLVPMSAPRGLPKDLSPRVRGIAQEFGNDGHSHSWYNFRELKDYFVTSTQMIRVGGLISLEEYQTLKENGALPSHSCRGAYGPNVKTIDEEGADALLSGAAPMDPNIQYFVDASWPVSIAEACKGFVTGITERLAPIAEEVGEENVRIVFWFDN